MKPLAMVLVFIMLAISIWAQLIPVQNNGSGVSGTWNILVIPVEFNNWAHNQPINPTYNPYFDPVEISDLEERYNTFAKDYYAMTSRGKVNVNFHVFPQWINMGNMTSYAGSAFAPTSLLTGSISAYNNRYSSVPGWNHESYYDKTVIAFAGPVYQDEWDHEWTGTNWSISQFIWAIAYMAGDNGKANCISIYSGVGVITHELGHALFNLKDKDVSSRIPNYRYQLMGAGAWNGCDALDPNAYQSSDLYKNVVPTPIEPWIRVNMGWENQPTQISVGNQEARFLLAPITDQNLINDPENYRNLVAISAGNSYFLLENRQHNINLTSTPNVDWNLPNSESWDIALPSEGVLVWKITDSWRSSYGYDSSYSSITQLWSEVVDANPTTTTLPVSYRYRYIDGHDSAIGSRTSAFNDVNGYNILGKYDAPITLGQSFTLPGTSVVVTYETRYLNGSVHVRLSNVNSSINDPAPNLAMPTLNVNPGSIVANMGTEQVQNRQLAISNTGEEGSLLEYSIQLSESLPSRDRTEIVTIGNGTDYWPRPFDTWNARGRAVSLLTSSEIGRTGSITHLGWSVRTARSYNLPIKIWLKPTSISSVTTASWDTNGATLVYDGTYAFSSTGWKTIDITDYLYNSGNLMVLTETNYGGSGTSANVQFHNVTNATSMHAWNRDSGGFSVDSRRPNIRLTFAPLLSLTIVQPNGGELFRVGETREITWSTTGSISQVDILFSNDGGSGWSTVASQINNQDNYQWIVHNQVSNQCKIKVLSSSDPLVFGQSASVFEIQPFVPGFQFTNIQAAQRFANGTDYLVTWNTVGNIAQVTLELSLDNGQSWTELLSSANNGSYQWSVWHHRSESCRFRLSDASDTQVQELSPVFEVYQPFTWLSVSDLSGSLGSGDVDNITLGFDSHGIYPGLYQAYLTINATGQTQVVAIELTVSDLIDLPSPQNVRIEVIGANIMLSWDPVANAEYLIFASDTPNGSFEFIESSFEPSWVDSVHYKRFFYVRARALRIPVSGSQSALEEQFPPTQSLLLSK